VSYKRTQGETFRDLMASNNNLLYKDADTEALSTQIQEAYNADDISPSQYAKLKRELDA